MGKITAAVETKNFKGTFTKTINVQTNDEAKQNFVLSLKMNVITLLNIDPEFVNINTFVGEEGRAAIKLTSQKKEYFKIKDLKVDNPEIKIFIDKPEKEEEIKEKGYAITLVAPPTLKHQHYNGKITFKTSISEQPEAEINYHIFVQKLIYFSPEIVYMNISDRIYKIIPLENIPIYDSGIEGANIIGELKANLEVPVQSLLGDYGIIKYEGKDGYVKLDKVKKIYGGTKANLWVNSHKKENFEVIKVECELGELKAQIKKRNENSYQIIFEYEGELPKSNIGTKVKIYTNDKEEPVIEVPVSINLAFSKGPMPREIKQIPMKRELLLKEQQKNKEGIK